MRTNIILILILTGCFITLFGLFLMIVTPVGHGDQANWLFTGITNATTGLYSGIAVMLGVFFVIVSTAFQK